MALRRNRRGHIADHAAHAAGEDELRPYGTLPAAVSCKTVRHTCSSVNPGLPNGMVGIIRAATSSTTRITQVLFYFGLSAAAFLIAAQLLWTKYVKKTKRATRDRGAYTLFALFMLTVSAGAFALGVLTQ